MKLILLAFVLLISCTNRNGSIQNQVIFPKPSLEDSMSFYFPTVLNDTVKFKNPCYENFEQNWYSSSLYSFKVQILYNKNDLQTTYRLLWLRSFHRPVCFSMKEFKGDYYLNAKMLDRQPSFCLTIGIDHSETGKEIRDTVEKADRFAIISFDTTIVLKNSKWNEIESFLSDMGFWESPLRDPNEEPTNDGSYWILEGRKNNKYHFFVRHNGFGNLKDFGKYLIKLSGVKIKEQDIY